ncbi:hypothetical protein [Belnapia arida]|nr:hypothetical protein [Belnapia arida]
MTGQSGHMPLFALGEDRSPAAPAGIWTRWSPIREVKEDGAPAAS